jgi:hypothetical protein
MRPCGFLAVDEGDGAFYRGFNRHAHPKKQNPAGGLAAGPTGRKYHLENSPNPLGLSTAKMHTAKMHRQTSKRSADPRSWGPRFFFRKSRRSHRRRPSLRLLGHCPSMPYNEKMGKELVNRLKGVQ